ncbi:hypothetical protein Daesc_005266 [Daldinia eschscholtzii]|uniref:PNPLA domain-containing protein n=1 Tax=Daldinia eschscholtzii TaxID=292717 RepID=A0AAX6MK19_9PEZI
MSSGARFILEEKLREVIKDQLGEAEERLLEEKPQWKVLVCTVMPNGRPRRLGNYHSKDEESIKCRIWEAARATSAAPTFFEPITFDDCIYRDGAMGIGTGVPASIALDNSLKSIAKALLRIATDTEQKAQDFKKIYGDRYRGSVQDASENPNWGQEATSWAEKELENRGKLDGLNPAHCWQPPRIWTVNPEGQTAPRNDYMINWQIPSSSTSSGAPSWTESGMCSHGGSQNIDVKILALVGLGGSGKTQLMLKYAYLDRGQYDVVLWIDATSKDAIAKSCHHAASQLGLVLPPLRRADPTSPSSLVVYNSELGTNVAAVEKGAREKGSAVANAL